jgi:hypothetical protein
MRQNSLQLLRRPASFAGYPGHAHFWERAVSRRNFVSASGLAGLLTVAGAVDASPGSEPRPIPGGFQGPGGELFHVFFFGPGAEPSTITDFNGSVGVAAVQGPWSGGPPATPPRVFDTDMRFMDGEYVGKDGKQHHGAFVFIWIDLYEGPLAPDFVNFSNQRHDFDPGIGADGLFWTVPLPSAGALKVHPGSGEASLEVNNISISDYFNIPNALTRGPHAPATASFAVHWAKGDKRTKVRDKTSGFAGEFVENTATMSFSVTTSAGTFLSGPETASASYFATVGHERNGVFFTHED